MSIIDFHNHLIPAVDDGAQSIAESREGIAELVQHGVTSLIATPHFEGGLTLNTELRDARLAEIDDGWGELTSLCQEEFPQLQIFRGVELLLDVPEPDLGDARLRLNGGRFFLVEFPFMSVPPQSVRVIGSLASGAYTPILAHPERYQGITAVDMAGEWRNAGALLQVNGGSLLGRYGNTAKKLAFELLERGWVDFMCSDYHARGPALIREYRSCLLELGAEEQMHLLTETNPGRLLRGEPPVPVPPLRGRKPSVWQRVSAIFR